MVESRLASLRRFWNEVPITFVLLAILGVWYFGQNLLSGFVGSGPTRRFGVLSVEALWASGSNGPGALFERGELWRLSASTFLHGGIYHFVFNAFALSQLGPIAEVTLGRGRTLLTWLVTGLIASLASATYWQLTRGYAIGVGASGAVFGLVGALLVFFRRSPGIAARHYYRSLIQMAVLNGVLGLVIPNIDNAAHAGGLLAGLLLGSVFPVTGRGRRTVFRLAATRVLIAATVVCLGIAAIGARGRLLTIQKSREFSIDLAAAFEAVESDPPDPALAKRRIETTKLPENLEAFRQEALAALERSGAPLSLTILSNRLYANLVRIAPDIFKD
jgi:membrane associated rhomboid family serine protease